MIRASYGMFYDHPLLGLVLPWRCVGRFVQRTVGLCRDRKLYRKRREPGNLNAIPIFQGLQNSCLGARHRFSQPANANLGYLPNQQQFQSLNFPQSVFLNQNYLEPQPSQSRAIDFLAARVPAVRVSAVGEFCLCLLAAGERER